MAPLGPFEPAPHIAVAVSGGADSLALTLLAAAWAEARGGRLTGLTVDHGLRPGSAAEARQVARWLRAAGIAHHTLRWRGAKPRTGIQEAARAARLARLGAWCRRSAVLHLLVAHHAEDQAETVLHRLLRGSGLDGLAAMAPARILSDAGGRDVRLLRPVLGVPRERLAATLAARGQPWIDDPSNRNPAFARTRLASRLSDLADDGMSPRRLARTARRAAEDRDALDAAACAWLAVHALAHPAGFVRLDSDAWRRTPRALGRRMLARALMVVAGAAYPPRLERLERLVNALGAGDTAPATLGGCRIVPARGRILVVREPAAAREACVVRPGQAVFWDRRMLVSVRGAAGGPALGLARLGAAGLAAIRRAARESGRPCALAGLPAAAGPGLPALRDLEGILSVPHLGFMRTDAQTLGVSEVSAAFRPAHPLGALGAPMLRMG